MYHTTTCMLPWQWSMVNLCAVRRPAQPHRPVMMERVTGVNVASEPLTTITTTLAVRWKENWWEWRRPGNWFSFVKNILIPRVVKALRLICWRENALKRIIISEQFLRSRSAGAAVEGGCKFPIFFYPFSPILPYQVLKCMLQINQMKLDLMKNLKKVNIWWYCWIGDLVASVFEQRGAGDTYRRNTESISL